MLCRMYHYSKTTFVSTAENWATKQKQLMRTMYYQIPLWKV